MNTKTGAFDRFDAQAEVVVVGGGPAGMTAAIAASRRASEVVVLEKDAATGGTAAKGAGGFWILNNRFMREQGIDDPRQDALRLMARLSRPALYDPGGDTLGLPAREYALIETYYDRGTAVLETLEELGLRVTQQSPVGAPFPDYHALLPENKATVGRLLFSLRPDDQVGDGRELLGQLRRRAENAGAAIMLDHRVLDCITDASGAVIGVSAGRPDGSVVRVGASRGVVFASGGFTHNPELRRNFLHGPTFGGCATHTNTGDFVPIASRLGAQLGNMNYAWQAPIVLEWFLENRPGAQASFSVAGDSMLFVNKYGRRVVNEKAPYNELAEVFYQWDIPRAEYPNLLLMMIWDERCAERFGSPILGNPIPPADGDKSHVVSGQTLDDLAHAVDARLAHLGPRAAGVLLATGFVENLEGSIRRFNEHAQAGDDPDQLRGQSPVDLAYNGPAQPDNPGNPTMFPLSARGPYHATIMAPGTLDTKGGPVINEHGQILDWNGEPIPGLFGAGNCIASPAAQAYWSGGGTIGPAITFGWVAGESAALRANRKTDARKRRDMTSGGNTRPSGATSAGDPIEASR